jgi:hypothetical protein
VALPAAAAVLAVFVATCVLVRRAAALPVTTFGSPPPSPSAGSSPRTAVRKLEFSGWTDGSPEIPIADWFSRVA